jgi:hypothetical protein
MKSNWLTYVAITASLIAGFLCSTAFADNKGGMKFSGGGGNSGRTMQFQQSNNTLRNLGNIQSSNFGGVQTQIKNNNLQSGVSGRNLGITLGNGGTNGQGLGGIQTQIKSGHLNGNLGQVLGQGGSNGNSGIVGRTPQIKINPGTVGGIVNGTGNGQGNGTGINLGNIKIGNRIGTPGNGQGNGLGISLGNSTVRSAININKQCHTAPKCIDPCFSKGCSPCGNKCSPCLKNWNVNCIPWWWTCHTHYCGCPVYYPVYTTPIIVTVPVAVPVGVPVIEERLVQVPVGSTITMQALGLGDVAGRMILVMDKVSLESQIVDWKLEGVTATLPMFDLAAPVPAELVIVKGDGQPATSMKIELIPAQPAAAAQQAVGAVQQAQFTQPAGELSAAAALVQ